MSLLDWFANRNKGETDASLKQKGVREFRAKPREIPKRGADLQKAKEQFGDFDIIDDPAAEAEAKRLAAETERKAKEEAERQEMERYQQLMEEEWEEERRQAKLLAFARGWRARAALPRIRAERPREIEEAWNTFLEKFRRANKEIDTAISKVQCWRCGQKGRLPVEDEVLFATPPDPRSVAELPMDRAMHYINVSSRNYGNLHQARREAVRAWIMYNNSRLPVEKMRLDASYHPQLSHRYQLSRVCEVCGSQGMFHASHFQSINERWRGIMGNAVTKVPGTVYGENWVAITDLSKDQAKFWLKAFPRPETRTRETHEYLLIKENPEMTIRKFDINEHPTLWGKPTDRVGTYDVYRDSSFFDKLGGDYETFVKSIRIPRIINKLQLIWPDSEYWKNNPLIPAKWKGGASQPLYIKPGVVYEFEQQDPLCKEPRKSTSPPARKITPSIALLSARKGFWLSELK